jgi:aspartate aminotransferase-like enzyme
VASESWEFEAIHRLNHRAFTAEIPQHPPNPAGRLVDRFHGENTYVIAVRGAEVLGMIAVRGTRPFSLDDKLPDLDAHLPAGRRVCELRLLTIAKEHRTGRLLAGLLGYVWRHCLHAGYDAAVISGTMRQLKLYRRLGFTPFGPLVGSAAARFQPMLVARDGVSSRLARLDEERLPRSATRPLNLLPGPVAVHRGVRRALTEPPESHRSAPFAGALESIRRLLSGLTGAARAQILLGSGTLANDAVAAQLSGRSRRGLILTNGEFGDRLVDHAARAGAPCDVMRWCWGAPFDLSAVRERMARTAPAWLWFVHLETSTGVLNDLTALAALCSRAGVRLCVDAVSAIGTVPTSLETAWFASGVSGKGLGAFPGLGIVLYNHALEPAARIPRYLDLSLYEAHGGVPFTHSSNLIGALRAALAQTDWVARFAAIAGRSASLRAHLRDCGFQLVSAEPDAAPGIVTIALPPGTTAALAAERMRDAGYDLAANSAYLRARNWIQISLMSEPTEEELRAAAGALAGICSTGAAAPR